MSCGDQTATFTPESPLFAFTTYTATVTTAIADEAGNPLSADFSWNFTTGRDATPPQIQSVSPAADQTNVPVTTSVSATFNHNLDCTTVTELTFLVVITPPTIVPGTISCNGQTVTFVSTAPLLSLTTYTIGLSRNIKDVSGNNFAGRDMGDGVTFGDFVWRFTTEDDTIPPSVTAVSPTDGATGVSTTTSEVVVTFSKSIACATVTSISFTLMGPGGSVGGTMSCFGNTATVLDPTLAVQTAYTVTVTTAITDLTGHALANPFTSSFTTGNATPPAIGAATEWATWSNPVNNFTTGSFTDGRNVLMGSFFDGIINSGEPAGGEYTASPAIPGQSDGLNPSFIRALTGSRHPTVIHTGDQIIAIDLTGFTGDAEPIFGLADLNGILRYRLELLDSSRIPLALAGIQTTSYNLTYPNIGSGLVADYNITLNTNTGALTVNPIHDADGFYDQSGLTTFTNLPSQTRHILLRSDSTQGSEGIQLYFGSSRITVGSFPHFDATDEGTRPRF